MGKSLTIKAAFDALEQLSPFVDSIAEPYGEVVQNQVKLAVHELCMNIIQHGYAGAEGDLRLEAELKGDILTLVITDSAPNAFDESILDGPPDPLDLPESGWGMFILAQIMDEIHYNRTSTGNKWTLLKNFAQFKEG